MAEGILVRDGERRRLVLRLCLVAAFSLLFFMSPHGVLLYTPNAISFSFARWHQAIDKLENIGYEISIYTTYLEGVFLFLFFKVMREHYVHSMVICCGIYSTI